MTVAVVDGDVLLYMSMWGKTSLEEAKEEFKAKFNSVLEQLFTEDYVMAMGGPDNFRNDLYSEYKSSPSRVKSSSTKPEWFNELKSWTVDYYEGCILTDNCEADDMIRVWSLELYKAGKDYCVVSVDKDLDCIAGKHLNPRKGELYKVDQEWADYFYWKQLLMGDSVDNIPGLPGIGPKKAEAILAGTTNHRERKKIVCKAYYNQFKEEGFNHMLLNGKLLHIWRYIGDHFSIDKEVYNDAIKG
jgi:5'-3' exonuclease